MKTIAPKSFLLGAFGVLILIFLLSSREPESNSNIEFVGSPYGIGIYNKDTKMLYMYINAIPGLRAKPAQVLKVADDGSSLTEIKQ